MAMRLLHAASVQLDVPLRGVGSVPRDLLDLVSTATLTAWDRLIDAAVTHDVDALLLTSDTFDAEASSLAADVALRQGLEKLAEREIAVFVVPGPRDPLAAWQEIPFLPENVTIFDSPWDSPVDLSDRGQTKWTIFPASSSGTEAPSPEQDKLRALRKPGSNGPRPVTVGMLWEAEGAVADAGAITTPRAAALDVLLCSDRSGSSARPNGEVMIRRQAAPQGMTPAEIGARGATLIEADSNRKLSARLLSLAPIRRERLTARLEGVRHRDDLCDQMLARLEELPALPGEELRIVEWVFEGSSAAWKRLDLSEPALDEVAQQLTELTDQPGKLRSLHRAAPLWQESVDEQQINDLWKDYLSLYDQRPTLDAAELRKLAMELRPQQAVPDGVWERWLQHVSPQEVARRARGFGRRWFAGA